MRLGELIERLKQEPSGNVIKNGFGKSMSYRGDYYQIAFEPAANVTIGYMLQEAENAIGRTYTGYKGGDFIMDEYVDVYLANYGNTGDEISGILLDYMLANIV